MTVEAEREQTSPLTLQRLRLVAAGYSPLPIEGKRPPMKDWQSKFKTSRAEIALWEKSWPTSSNTGVLTKFVPALDIDIMHAEAADAVEALAREHFEERGHIAVRFGKAPKRAILLRTDEPFNKLARVFTAPNGSEEKIEILADGQQVVAFGTHPETKRGYSWHGGEPDEIKRSELPYVREADARAFLDAAAELLVKDFGYADKGGSKQQAKDGAEQQQDDHADPLDWGILISRIYAGENLHDTIRDLAASFIRSGMADKAAIARLRELMTASTIDKDARWRERYDDIARAVRTAREKFDQHDDANAEQQPEPAELHWHGDADPRESRPYLVQDLIPEIGAGLMSGQWGTYKTFTLFDLAHSIMTGAPFIGFEIVRRGGILFIALEGTDEVAIRLQGVIDHKGHWLAGQRAPFAWSTTCPRLINSDAVDELVKLAEQAAAKMQADFNLPLAMIGIDTVIAAAGYTKDGQDNDSAAGQGIMNTLAKLARRAKCFVIGVDHFGKDISTGTRGSSVKEGSADVVLALLGDKSMSGEVTNTRLAIRKRRGGSNGQEIPFKPRVVDMGTDDRGVPMTTLVIDWNATAETADTTQTDPRWSKSLRLLRQVIMTVMVDHGRETRPFHDGPSVRAVDVEIARQEFYRSYLAEGDTEAKKQTSRRQAFHRATTAARNKDLITTRTVDGAELIWLTKPEPDRGK
jgi:hypothetical protein